METNLYSRASELDEVMFILNLLGVGSVLVVAAAAIQRPYSVALDEPKQPDEGPIRRLRSVASGELTETISHLPQIRTVYDLVSNAVDRWDAKDCLGSRKVVRQIQEQKNLTKLVNGVETQVQKTWVYSELSPYGYRTYERFGIELHSVGSVLRKLGLKHGDKVGMYAETRYLCPNEC